MFRRAHAVCVLVVVATLPALAQSGASAESERMRAARALFDRYVALERAFDPAMADLYSDTAVIRNRRTYPTGQVREMTIPAPQYKELIKQAMPLAKAANDTNRYSDCAYTAEGEQVRIKCTRFGERKQYSSPMELLVGRGPSGAWLVMQELGESQP